MTKKTHLYENDEDRDNQQRVIEYVMNKWNFTAHDMPLAYEFDFACMRDKKVDAMVEVRCRNIDVNQFDTMIMSNKKYMWAIQNGDESLSIKNGKLSHIPFLFVVWWKKSKTLGYIDLNKRKEELIDKFYNPRGLVHRPELGLQLKDYRNDYRDRETLRHFKIKDFCIISNNFG